MKTLSIIALSLFLQVSTTLAASPISPNSTLTPGAIIPEATKSVICVPGYTKTVRNVPARLKLQVFKEYNTNRKADRYEIDHLISLELGGSNEIKNLWPESYTTKPLNAYKKDALENRLHKMICSGEITLKEAQDSIAKDWVSLYNKYIAK